MPRPPHLRPALKTTAVQRAPAPIAHLPDAFTLFSDIGNHPFASVGRRRTTHVSDVVEQRGVRIGVDLHSAVGRDLTMQILSGLGAECHGFRRVETFIAVDTEAGPLVPVLRDADALSLGDIEKAIGRRLPRGCDTYGGET